MEQLREYLNSIPVKQQAAYAIKCKTTIGYLRKAISVGQRLDGALCRLLDENSGGRVSRSDLRSDIWPRVKTGRKK